MESDLKTGLVGQFCSREGSVNWLCTTMHLQHAPRNHCSFRTSIVWQGCIYGFGGSLRAWHGGFRAAGNFGMDTRYPAHLCQLQSQKCFAAGQQSRKQSWYARMSSVCASDFVLFGAKAANRMLPTVISIPGAPLFARQGALSD